MNKSDLKVGRFVCIKNSAVIGIINTIANEEVFVKQIDSDTGIINDLPEKYSLDELDIFIPKFVKPPDDLWKKSFLE